MTTMTIEKPTQLTCPVGLAWCVTPHDDLDEMLATDRFEWSHDSAPAEVPYLSCGNSEPRGAGEGNVLSVTTTVLDSGSRYIDFYSRSVSLDLSADQARAIAAELRRHTDWIDQNWRGAGKPVAPAATRLPIGNAEGDDAGTIVELQFGAVLLGNHFDTQVMPAVFMNRIITETPESARRTARSMWVDKLGPVTWDISVWEARTLAVTLEVAADRIDAVGGAR